MDGVTPELSDVVVVGSGFGGAPPAFHLAEAGARVVILERGPRMTGSGLTAEPELTRWTRVFDVILGNGMITLAGNCVGGGSMHYYAVSLRAPAFAFERTSRDGARLWPARLSRPDLDPWYERVEEALPVTRLGWDDISRGGEIFSTACRRAGRDCSPVPLAVDLNACDNCGSMAGGCRVDAKRSMMLNYLPAAEAAGAEIRPLHEVQRLTPASTPGYRYRVEYDVLERGHYRVAGQGAIEARAVVIAAGTMATPVMLRRSASRLGPMPPALGRNFSPNGDVLTAFELRHNPARHGVMPFGKAITTMLTDRLDPGLPEFNRHSIQDADYFVLANVLAALRKTMLGSRPGAVQTTLGMCEDDNEGVFGAPPARGAFRRFGRGVGKSSLHYRPTARTRAAITRVESDLHEILGRDGGRIIRRPFRASEGLTAHPLSSCRLGDDPLTSALEDSHQLRGHPGIFVTDGSAVPGALCVNPSLTIAALAERASPLIIDYLNSAGLDISYRGSTPAQSRARLTLTRS
jgi:enediyne biosynthesis protein E9